jgi:methyl-accepting chemotaxis protein
VLWTVGFVLAVLLAIGGFAGVVAFRLADTLKKLGAAMRSLASGEIEITVPAVDSDDEIGDMARAVQVFKQNAVERAQFETEATTHRNLIEAERERVAAERVNAADEQSEVVRSLGAALRELAAGDLMVRLGDGFSTTYAQIRDDFNDAIDRLRSTVRSVVDSVNAIWSGAQEVSSASDDLSRRTEQQAAGIEQTAATLAEVTTVVKKSADGASHARQVVTAADGDARQSAVVVRQAVEAMSGISQSSQQIGQIVGVIDEIAFQTNLLALNAGVEAARAGDSGRGFAVVASEVRALAQRSADAAKEIKELISHSSDQVENGVKLVAETGRSLERIMAQVSEINAVVGDIAAGAQTQSTALQEINTAIDQMNMVTQENAAMVEESTAAGRTLSEESAKLAQLVGRFRVERPAVERPLKRYA